MRVINPSRKPKGAAQPRPDAVTGSSALNIPVSLQPSSQAVCPPTSIEACHVRISELEFLCENLQGMVAASTQSAANPTANHAAPSNVTAPTTALALPSMPAGSEMTVLIDGPALKIRVEPILGYTVDEACQRIPSQPHRDTLRAQLENSGIQIGAIGRTPLVSIDQLRQALKLGV